MARNTQDSVQQYMSFCCGVTWLDSECKLRKHSSWPGNPESLSQSGVEGLPVRPHTSPRSEPHWAGCGQQPLISPSPSLLLTLSSVSSLNFYLATPFPTECYLIFKHTWKSCRVTLRNKSPALCLHVQLPKARMIRILWRFLSPRAYVRFFVPVTQKHNSILCWGEGSTHYTFTRLIYFVLTYAAGIDLPKMGLG